MKPKVGCALSFPEGPPGFSRRTEINTEPSSLSLSVSNSVCLNARGHVCDEDQDQKHDISSFHREKQMHVKAITEGTLHLGTGRFRITDNMRNICECVLVELD
ncbi:uncharacterized [Tachysurus ichikawai]